MSDSNGRDNPENFDNQRGFKRAKGFAPVNADGVMGRLLDISRGGMAFSVGDSFENFVNDKKITITLKLPKNKDAPDGLEFRAEGRVLNPRMEANGKRMAVGFAFTPMDEASRDKLNRVILHFVRSYEPLNRLDEIMTVDKTPSAKTRKMDLVNLFNQVISDYDRLPKDAIAEIERFNRSMTEFMKAVNGGGLN